MLEKEGGKKHAIYPENDNMETAVDTSRRDEIFFKRPLRSKFRVVQIQLAISIAISSHGAYAELAGGREDCWAEFMSSIVKF